ncbi:MAG: cytochrome c biogenesis protein CcsA [Pseudomonadota bacterium]
MVSTPAVAVGLVAVASYLIATFLQARGYQASPAAADGPGAVAGKADSRVATLLALAALGVLAHGIANYLVIYSENALNLGLLTSTSLVSWIMLAFVLVVNTRLLVQNLLIIVLPIGTLGVVSLLATPAEATVPVASLNDPLIWHILVSILAYSILFMAACQSVLLAVLEHRLKTKQTRLLKLLPPLQSMETLLFNLLWTGILVLTAAIATGFIFLDDMFQQRVVHHTILAIVSWVLYAVLLAGHHLLGWRGTTAVRWTLIAFGVLVLGYFGSKFVIEILLPN